MQTVLKWAGWVLVCTVCVLWDASSTEAGTVYRFRAGGNGKGKAISKGWGAVRLMTVERGWEWPGDRGQSPPGTRPPRPIRGRQP